MPVFRKLIWVFFQYPEIHSLRRVCCQLRTRSNQTIKIEAEEGVTATLELA